MFSIFEVKSHGGSMIYCYRNRCKISGGTCVELGELGVKWLQCAKLCEEYTEYLYGDSNTMKKRLQIWFDRLYPDLGFNCRNGCWNKIHCGLTWRTVITCSVCFSFQVFLKRHQEFPEQLKTGADDFMYCCTSGHGWWNLPRDVWQTSWWKEK